MSAGDVVRYKCHAGLECFTAPMQIGDEPNLAVIGGRAFLSSADYRSLVERFRDGELNELLDRTPFDNVIFSEPQRLTQLSERLRKATSNLSATTPAAAQPTSTPVPKTDTPAIEARVDPAVEEQPELRREVDRLRGELRHRSHVTESLQHFLERITSTTPEEAYLAILTHTRSLLRAERGSLMVFDEDSNELVLRAAIGLPVPTATIKRARPGEGVAGRVIESGKAMVVANAAAHPGARVKDYKTQSFISYPITIHGRKIGVLNITDKATGEVFDEVDLSLLDLVGPQIAVALERAEWQDRATQYQLMSITDPLTGLLNRRYLEERLTEELNRSTRYNYSTSCLMIDIDDFKKYNDLNGHQAGDVALKMTAHCLKAALRSADVACRYGGEEFCILLPQTSLSEAGVIAERMRQRVMETVFPHGQSQPLGHVSISIGISTFTSHVDTAEKIIAAADRALYAAKGRGKNRIEFFGDTAAPANK